MAITHTKTEIMNTALRMVGSYHIEDSDTTSTTYEIVNRAFEDCVLSVFSDNIFQYNTRRVYNTGVATSTLATADKPGDQWDYRHTLTTLAPGAVSSLNLNLLLKVTSEDGARMLDFYLEGAQSGDIGSNHYIFTSEEKVHIYYSFVPDFLNVPEDSGTAPSSTVTTMPDFLVRLLSLCIAYTICVELSGDDKRAEMLYAQYTQALRRARVLEGRSSPAQQYIHDGNSSFVAAHRNYGEIY